MEGFGVASMPVRRNTAVAVEGDADFEVGTVGLDTVFDEVHGIFDLGVDDCAEGGVFQPTGED